MQSNVKATVREKYEHNLTAEDVAKEADGIWTLFKKTFPKKEAHDPAKLSDFYKEMQSEHREFGQTYPVVLRYMCQLGQYNGKAFRRYLKYISRNPWKGVDSYLESQATYAKLLYQALNQHYNPEHAKAYYNNVLTALKKEREQFETETKESEARVKEEHENRVIRNKIELREFFETFGMEAVDVPVRVETSEKVVELPADVAAAYALQEQAAAADAKREIDELDGF